MHCISQIGETTIHFKDKNEWNKEDYKKEMPQLNKIVDNAVNNTVVMMGDIVGHDNSNKYRFKKIRKKMIKYYGDEEINKKIIKGIADGIIIPSIPTKL
jgi:hypothetical protein